MLATKTEIKSNNVYFMVLLTPCSFCTYTCTHTLHLSLWNHFHCHTLSHPPHTTYAHCLVHTERLKAHGGCNYAVLEFTHLRYWGPCAHDAVHHDATAKQRSWVSSYQHSPPRKQSEHSTMTTRNMSIPFLLFSFFCSIYLSCQIIMTSCLIHINVGLLLAFSPETSLPAESHTGHISSLWSFVGVLSFWYLKKMFPIFIFVCMFCIA